MVKRRQRDDLTEREREVLALLVDGLRDREIATRLHLSESSVKTHLKAIYHRLRVRNRTQAAVLMVREHP